MHRLVVASLTAAGLSVGLAAAASAADLGQPAPAPVYTKAPPAPVYGWTGFYVGGNAGYGWDTSTANFSGNSLVDPFFAANEFPSSVSLNSKGWFAGGQAGYNWQVGPMWVVGLETDLQWADIKGSNSVSPVPTGFAPFTTSVSDKLDWFGTTRARAGFLAAPNILIYGTGGVAYGQTEVSFSTVNNTPPICPSNFTCAAGSNKSTKVGWTAGAGVEAAFWRNWSVKAEYLFMDLGSQSVTAFDTSTTGSPCHPTGAASSCSFTASNPFRDNIVRLGLNYKFN